MGCCVLCCSVLRLCVGVALFVVFVLLWVIVVGMLFWLVSLCERC